MTSIPEVPGAQAVVLYDEILTDDSLHMESHYRRIKVLSEGGKEYANVELPYLSDEAGMRVDSISGRTIQPDGTIVPFTGKPYEKLIAKHKDSAYKAKVFSLPAVQVGSILEYRYKYRLEDNYYRAPEWNVQSDLFTRKGSYTWFPTDKQLVDNTDDGQLTNRIAWTPHLPVGTEVVNKSTGMRQTISLKTQNIAPLEDEPYTPPMSGLNYRVQFYYTPYQTLQEFWAKSGKHYMKARDGFIGPNSAVRGATEKLVSGDATPTAKLQDIYKLIESFENTDYTREHSAQEDKADGLHEVKSTEDILNHKRGSGDQLTELFVAMARAAGLKAYLMAVPNRRYRLFLPNFLSFNQLDDFIAIVAVDGKDMTFDPGTRYENFGDLAWQHAGVGGLRQTDNGVSLAVTPLGRADETQGKRIADLTLDDQGVAKGTVTLTFTGQEASYWRRAAIKGDDTSLNKDLREYLEQMLPGGMKVRVSDVTGLTAWVGPLRIRYEVEGAIGTPTGKRLIMPRDLFESNARATFTQATRTLPIDLHYAEYLQDAVRLKLPPSLQVESVPPDDKQVLAGTAAFSILSKQAPGSITLFRNVNRAKVLLPAEEYPSLKSYHDKLNAQDQQSLILMRSAAATAVSAPAALGPAANISKP